MGVCDFCDDYNYGIKQVAGNGDFEGVKGNPHQAGGQRRLQLRQGPISLFFDSLLKGKGEEPPHTGGGRVVLPRCNTWSSGHTPAPGAPG